MLKTPVLMNTIFHNSIHQSRESPPLSSLFPNNSIFDLDATIGSSYNGGQLWKNIIAAPADGAAKNAYDFNLGANATVTTDDPTHTGGAGNPAAYFALDGGDYFSLAGNVTDTPFLNTVHQKLDHTVIMAVNFPASTAADIGLFSTCNTYDAANVGISYYGGYSFCFYRQRTAAGLVSASSGVISANNIPAIMMFSYDSVAGTVTRWVNTATGTSVSMAYNVTAAAWAGVKPTIGAIGTASKMPSGSRVYSCAMLNKAISNDEAAQIISFYNNRHGRVYA